MLVFLKTHNRVLHARQQPRARAGEWLRHLPYEERRAIGAHIALTQTDIRGGEMAKSNKHEGSLFGDFLRETGDYEEATARALKRVLSEQREESMDDREPDALIRKAV